MGIDAMTEASQPARSQSCQLNRLIVAERENQPVGDPPDQLSAAAVTETLARLMKAGDEWNSVPALAVHEQVQIGLRVEHMHRVEPPAPAQFGDGLLGVLGRLGIPGSVASPARRRVVGQACAGVEAA